MGEPLFDKRTIERALTAVAARLEVAGAEPVLFPEGHGALVEQT